MASFSFNTQPPEGGWISGVFEPAERGGFNTQPPEGGWFQSVISLDSYKGFQHTAARRRLACTKSGRWPKTTVSTHSRPKAAGVMAVVKVQTVVVSTHSRPKAAGLAYLVSAMMVFSFNTQPPEGGWKNAGNRQGV